MGCPFDGAAPLDHLAEHPVDPLAPFVKHPSRLGGHDAARRAFEQRDPHLLLEPTDLLRHRLRRHELGLGGL